MNDRGTVGTVRMGTVTRRLGHFGLVVLALLIAAWPFGAGRVHAGGARIVDTPVSFRHSMGIAVGKAGNVYVANGELHRIYKLSPNGDVSQFAQMGDPVDGRVNPCGGLAVDNMDDLFVAGCSGYLLTGFMGNREVKRYGRTDTPFALGYISAQSYTVVYGTPYPPTADTDYGRGYYLIYPSRVQALPSYSRVNFATGIAADNGQVYIAEHNRVSLFRSSGIPPEWTSTDVIPNAGCFDPVQGMALT